MNGIEAIQEKACLEDSIETLELSARTQNCLRRVKIRTVEDLVNYGYDNLLKITNFGKKRLDEVIKTLQDNGFYLKDQDARGYNENILEEAQALEKFVKILRKVGNGEETFVSACEKSKVDPTQVKLQASKALSLLADLSCK